MGWIALAGGLLGGALNYALLAAGCKKILDGMKRGALLILGGILAPVTGLLLCASISPSLLPWFGCACAGALGILSIADFIRRKKM